MQNGRMFRAWWVVLAAATFITRPASAQAQEATPPAGQPPAGEAAGARSKAEAVLRSIKWQPGPTKAVIGDQAELDIPEGYVFAGPDGTRKMLELMENPTHGRELGLLTDAQMGWFVIFEFSNIGYVEDAEEEELDADEIIGSIREGTKANNAERTKRGWPTVEIVGWQTAPFFDKGAKNLQWAIKGRSRGQEIVNYNTRLLGRHGVMSANLLVAPAKLDETLPAIKQLLSGFNFQDGKQYAQYEKGDKIAEYGLAALVVGGAVGVAAKLGLLAKLGKLWKLIIAGIIGLGAAIKKLLFGRGRKEEPIAEVAGDPPAEQ